RSINTCCIHFRILLPLVHRNNASSIVLQTADHTKLAGMVQEHHMILDGNTTKRIWQASSAPHLRPAALNVVPALLHLDRTYHAAVPRTHVAGRSFEEWCEYL